MLKPSEELKLDVKQKLPYVYLQAYYTIKRALCEKKEEFISSAFVRN